MTTIAVVAGAPDSAMPAPNVSKPARKAQNDEPTSSWESTQLGAQGQQLVGHAQSPFVDGLSQSLLAGAFALLVGAAFVALRAPGRAESKVNAMGAAAPSAAPAEAA